MNKSRKFFPNFEFFKKLRTLKKIPEIIHVLRRLYVITHPYTQKGSELGVSPCLLYVFGVAESEPGVSFVPARLGLDITSTNTLEYANFDESTQL